MLDRTAYREPSRRELQQDHASVSTGQLFNHRGAFASDALYTAMDIATVNGSAFLALRDNPGLCPGDGWRLLAATGKRGRRGPIGPKGEPGETPPTISDWHVDAGTYTVTPVMSDGRRGPPLELFGLFREFLQRM